MFRKVEAAQIRSGTSTHFAGPTTIIRENWRSPRPINWFPQTRVRPAAKRAAIERAEQFAAWDSVTRAFSTRGLPNPMSMTLYGEKNVEPYVKAGRLFRIFGWLGIGGIVVAIVIPVMINPNTPSSQPDASSWLPTILLLVLIAGISVLQLMVGSAIKEHKNWGRTVGIVLGIIHLFGFPIGTLIGAYILWCLIKGWEQ